MATGNQIPQSSEAPQLAQAVRVLRKQAPFNYKCIFLNCEFHETPGGMTVSGDLFAVTKRFLSRPSRKQWVLDAQLLTLLNSVARGFLQEAKEDHVTLDIVIGRTLHKSFVSFDPLRRIGGDDDFFKGKHKMYVHLEPLFLEVE